MRLTKTQTRVLVLMSVLLVLLFAAAFIIRFVPRGGDTPTGGTPVPHEKIRDARVSLTPEIEKEINIGGSKDDAPVSVFSYGDKIYIFGNTTSSDYDFDGVGGVFLSILSSQGRTVGFFQYGESGCKLVKAILSENGFLLAVDNPNSRAEILTVDFKGAAISEMKLSSLYAESFADIQLFNEEIVVFTNLLNETVSRNTIKARIFDQYMTLKTERILQRDLSIEYIDAFPYRNGAAEGYVVAANITNALVKRLTFITFGMGLTHAFHDIDIGEPFKAGDIIPYSGGYLALAVNEHKAADVFMISSDFQLFARIYLNNSAVDDAEMFFAPDGYYCLLKRSVDLTTMVRLDTTLANKESLSDFATVSNVTDTYIYQTSALFAATGSTDISLITMQDGKRLHRLDYGGAGMENVKVVKCGNKFVSVSASKQKTSDCGGNFGGKDVWIAFLNAF